MDDYPDPDIFRDQHRELMDFLTNSNEMRQTATSSLKQAAYAGGAALAGGLLLGPVGSMVGGIAGSILGFVQTEDYDGILRHMTKIDDDKKKFLLQRVGGILMAAGAASQTMLSVEGFKDALANLASKRELREELWNVCLSSLQE